MALGRLQNNNSKYNIQGVTGEIFFIKSVIKYDENTRMATRSTQDPAVTVGDYIIGGSRLSQ